MRSLKLVVLTLALPLGGCFTSTNDPLWPVESGEKLPFQSGSYLCTTSEGKTLNYEVKQLANGADLYYSLNDGHSDTTASFHRITSNDYVMEMTDGSTAEVTYLYLQLRDGKAQMLMQKNDVAREIAKDYGISTDGIKLAYVDSDAAKRYIVEVGRHLESAETLLTCSHT